MTPDPVISWNVVGTLLVLSNLAVAWLTLSRGNKAQKREVSFEQTYATKEEVNVIRTDVHRLADSIDGMRREAKRDKEDILQADEQRAIALHNRVNDVLAAVSELRGELNRVRK